MASVWLVWEDDYSNSYVAAAFTSEDEATAFAKDRRVEEIAVWEKVPTPWNYWHYGAEVYPDGVVTRWSKKHEGEGEVSMPPVDDHLNSDGRIWDGHTQGHCGEHISVFGTDRRAVRAAREKYVKESLARQNGDCPSKYHKGDIDGRTVYEVGWGEVRRAGSSVVEKLSCIDRFEHDFKEWSEWREVEVGSFNRSRVCKRCVVMEIACTSSPH